MTLNRIRIAAFFFGCSLTAAEEVMSETNDVAVAEIGPEDTYVVGLFCVLFALLMTLVAVVVGQYACLEDSLMKEYLEKAVVHEASVLSADFSRAATTARPATVCSTAEQSRSEYLAYVEYNVSNKETTKATIRKQVKVFASDFKKATSESDVPQAIKCDIEFALSFVPMRSIDDDMESTAADHQEVEVLVMPDYPRSGLPRSQVVRSISLSYRLPTAGLILFLLLLSGLCIYIGFELTPVAWIPVSLSSYQLTLLALTALLTAEVLLAITCLGEGMREGVREIFFEAGEFMKISHDDTTISSGDDSYLRI